jgi:hypothetical protein
MSPLEIQSHLKALAAHVGPKADVSVFMGLRWDHATLTILPSGDFIKDKARFSIEGTDWEELFRDAYAKWDEVSGVYDAKIVRDMALAIIRLTAELGKCSDGALRMEFAAEDIAKFGDRAAASANEMAANGPFSIVKTGDGNGAPRVEEAA